MSQFTSFTQNVHSRRQMQDERAVPRWEQWNNNGRYTPFEDGFLWPNSRMFGADTTLVLGQDASNTGKWGVQAVDESGGQQMVKISGITRDANGDPLGSVTVQGFLTADDTFVRQIVSDAGGEYVFTTEFLTEHYLVAYKAGSPDVGGTSVNTLTGS